MMFLAGFVREIQATIKRLEDQEEVGKDISWDDASEQ